MNHICERCGNSYEYVRDRGNSLRHCGSCMANRRRFFITQKAIEYKGGSCQICGYNKCSRALTFHHRNPKEKSFVISGAHCRSWEAIRTELDKCDLLCFNCHMEVHHAEDQKRIEGDIWVPQPKRPKRQIKNVCKYCKKEFIRDKKRSFCSFKCHDNSQSICPSREVLEADKAKLKTSKAIAKKYRVAESTVRNWLRKFGINKNAEGAPAFPTHPERTE
jgi:hypothetical protein